MIDLTSGHTFTIVMIAVAFFCAGRLWEHEHAARQEERRSARRRAHRINTTQKEGK